MKLAKPLKAGGSPLMIVTGSSGRSGRMAEQLRRSVDREALRAARSSASSPKHDKPRKKVLDMEGERVTCRVPRSADKTGQRSVLNQRSQKKSYNWTSFKAMWKTLDIPNPKIIETQSPIRPCLL